MSCVTNLPVARVFVPDASPLIFLARVGHLGLLAQIAHDVMVPVAVMDELDAGFSRDRAAEAVRAATGVRTVPDTQVPPEVARSDLGVGESQVIALAMSLAGAEAILDDRAARRCAAALGVPILGTIGILTIARRLDLIPALKPVLDALKAHGMRLAPQLRAEALKVVGEQD